MPPKKKSEDLYSPSMDNYFEIKDTRTVHPVTGKPINPNRDLKSGKYSWEGAKAGVFAAKLAGVDPNLYLAMLGQETTWLKDDPEYLHAKDYSIFDVADKLGLNEAQINEYNQKYFNFPFALSGAYAIKDKFDKAKKAGLTELVDQLQFYNGYNSTINTNTEKKYHDKTGRSTKYFYGVDVSKTPINTKENPVYGKTVMSLLPLIQNNADIQRLIEYPDYVPGKDRTNTSGTKSGGQTDFAQFKNGGYLPKAEDSKSITTPGKVLIRNADGTTTEYDTSSDS